MKNVAMFIVGLIILITLILSTYYIYEQRTYTVRSRANAYSVSPSNTYVFTTPACGSSVRLYVFCMNDRGFGVPNMNVYVKDGENFNVVIVQGITNENGEATFDITSDLSGTYATSISCGETTVKEAFALCLE